VTIEATDYSYGGLEGMSFTKGETVEFRLHNEAPAEKHELEIFGPDGDALGEVGPTKAGATGHVVVTLTEAGTYRVNCGIEDHADKGMKGTFTVT
jgi:plastocyanin